MNQLNSRRSSSSIEWDDAAVMKELLHEERIHQIYDHVAHDWARTGPLVHDDLVGRPFVVGLSRKLAAEGNIIDLACGDGNVSRMVGSFAKSVVGIDRSGAMLSEARRLSSAQLNIEYIKADIVDLQDVRLPWRADLVLALYALCCLRRKAEIGQACRGMFVALKEGGHVIVQIPHPMDEFLAESPTWWQDMDKHDSYFDEGVFIRRKLRTLNGRWLVVARYHHPLSTYITSLADAGFVIKAIYEPKPTAAQVQVDPTLARELRVPYTLVFLAQRPVLC